MAALTPQEHGMLDPETYGTRTGHTIRGFTDAADETARVAIVQTALDRSRVQEQTGGNVPGLYLPNGAGGWKRFNLDDAPEITEAISGGNKDDWDPTAWAHLKVLRITLDAARDITGLVPSAGIRFLVNADATFTFTLKDDATSSAVNRFIIAGGDLAVAPNAVARIWYDPVTQRNRVM